MPKYIIFGGNGMLAHAIKTHEFFKDNVAPDVEECDITDFDKIDEYLGASGVGVRGQGSGVSLGNREQGIGKCSQIPNPKSQIPNLATIINCAAYTDVTKAETDLSTAMKVNAEGAKNLAIIANKYKCKLIHFSTDFVFKGDKDIVYTEEMKPNPVNNYGLSKLKGEEYILEYCPDALIVRVSWLYGPNGKNFVSTITKLIQEKPELNIVSDQFGKTTYTLDVAEAVKNLIECDAKGIFHFANEGVSSRYEFTLQIVASGKWQVASDVGANIICPINCKISPIKASDYPDPTPRPTWSILSTEKYTKTTGKVVKRWEEALSHFIMSNEGQGASDEQQVAVHSPQPTVH